MLVRAAKEGDEGNVYEEAVLPAYLKGYLTNRLKKRLGLNVSDSSAYFGNYHVGIGLPSDAVNEFLYLVRYVRNYLNRRAEIFSPALLVQYVPVDLSRRQIGIFVEVLVYESLVMSEVEIRLRAVIGYVNLSVLIRAHRTRIDVDIRVELLSRNLKSSRFKKPSERGGGYSLSETGYNSSRNEYILCHHSHLQSALPVISRLCF